MHGSVKIEMKYESVKDNYLVNHNNEFETLVRFEIQSRLQMRNTDCMVFLNLIPLLAPTFILS